MQHFFSGATCAEKCPVQSIPNKSKPPWLILRFMYSVQIMGIEKMERHIIHVASYRSFHIQESSTSLPSSHFFLAVLTNVSNSPLVSHMP